MIQVTGGCYVELCIEPLWEQLFGSGLRAAAAISELSDNVEFTGYSSDEDRNSVKSVAASFNVTAKVASAPQTISFSYYHGLSEPRIRPPLHLIRKADTQTVQAPNILRFGVLEGDIVVHGDRVVFDPQDAYNPRSFRENGSTAGRLAVVANLGEARALSGRVNEKLDPTSLGRAVLEAEQAEVVIIKRGSFGATVVTASQQVDIPAYRTRLVWPIGSGDIFAAVFAHYWTSEGVDAVEAAKRASLATAYYCESKVLPIPIGLRDTFKPEPAITGPGNFPHSQKQVYVAGPFFTMADRWMVEQSSRYLKQQQFKVFSPYHDVGYGTASEVVPADIKALNESDVVYAMLDGLDAGTIFEVGHARAMGKPVVGFVQNESADDLKMLEGTNCEIVNDFVSSIYRLTWAAMAL